MATINPYLSFNGNAEEAFNFYKSVFGGEFTMLHRYDAMPAMEGCPPLSESDKQKIMHVSLPIGKDNILMASDILEGAGHPRAEGNNIQLNINASSEDEARTLFNALSVGGNIQMPLEKAFWGALFGMFSDRFGTRWMVNYDYQN